MFHVKHARTWLPRVHKAVHILGTRSLQVCHCDISSSDSRPAFHAPDVPTRTLNATLNGKEHPNECSFQPSSWFTARGFLQPAGPSGHP